MKKFKRAVTDSGTRSSARRRQARHLEPDRAPRGDPRRRAPRTSSASSPTPATATSRSRSARRSSSTSRPVRERYAELRADEAELEEILAGGADGARALAAETLADVRERMGVGSRVRRPGSLASRGVPATAVHRLELDLDVFAGPFDLLLSLILREELDLLEVELAEVVLAYLDHLEARDELDLEATTEFLVLIAALLELKSRLMLPGEEVEELDELAPAEAAERAARAHAPLRALPRRRGLAGRAQARAARRCSTARRRCPTSCGGCRSSRPRRPTTRRCSARRSAACCARRRRSTSATWRCRGSRSASACAPARAAAPRRASGSTRRSGRRPRHGRGDAVRAARALQARRGELGAGRAVRCRSR